MDEHEKVKRELFHKVERGVRLAGELMRVANVQLLGSDPAEREDAVATLEAIANHAQDATIAADKLRGLLTGRDVHTGRAVILTNKCKRCGTVAVYDGNRCAACGEVHS